MNVIQATSMHSMSNGRPLAEQRRTMTSALTPTRTANGVSWWLGTAAANKMITTAISPARWAEGSSSIGAGMGRTSNRVEIFGEGSGGRQGRNRAEAGQVDRS